MTVTHTESGTPVAEMMLSNCPGKSSKQNRRKQETLGSEVGFFGGGGGGETCFVSFSFPLPFQILCKKSITFVVGNKYVKGIKR